MKAKIFIACISYLSVVGCGQSGDNSNMDKTTDSKNTEATYPTSSDTGYRSSADSVNYNNRNISADDSPSQRKRLAGDTATKNN